MAARPAVEEAAFALNIAQNIGTKGLDKTPVAIFMLNGYGCSEPDASC